MGRAGGLAVGAGAGARFRVSAREEGACVGVPPRDERRRTTRPAFEQGAVANHLRALPHCTRRPAFVGLDGLGSLRLVAADLQALEPQNI